MKQIDEYNITVNSFPYKNETRRGFTIGISDEFLLKNPRLMCLTLAAGISIIIKNQDLNIDGKGHKLLKEVIDQLENDFVSLDAYEDTINLANIKQE